MKNRKWFMIVGCISLIIGFGHTSYAGNITGLWEISHVQMGEEEMTPVARWTRINQDGYYQSGNGWLQNAEGSWTYHDINQTILMEDKNGIIDEFGAFNVSFQSGKMVWKRAEGGAEVVVTLKRIEKIPKAPADYLTGLWGLQESNKNVQTIDKTLFFRWDKIYIERTSEGSRSTGYWHINGHRPEITLLSHQQDQAPESWKIEVDDARLILIGISDTNKDKKLSYQRLQSFPN